MEDIGFDNGQSTPVRNNNNNKKSIQGIIIVAVVVFVIIVAVVISVAATTSETKHKKSIEVINASMSVEYIEGFGYTATISGQAKNNTGKNLSYAQIGFAVYDSAGNNLGTAWANINYLADGDTWNFKATLFGIPDTQPTSYKFADSSFF